MVEKWDKDEAFKDAKTWETVEGSEKAMNHILNKYVRTRTDMKIYPSKQTADEVLDLFTNTLVFLFFAILEFMVIRSKGTENYTTIAS